MQVIFKNKDERSYSKEANSVDTIICAGGNSRYQKENVLEDLETEILEYKTIGEFLADLKKEFGKEKEEMIKAAELRRLKQEEKIMEEFV